MRHSTPSRPPTTAENKKKIDKTLQRTNINTIFMALLLAVSLSSLGMASYSMAKKSTYEAGSKSDLYSNSSTIQIRDGDEVVITSIDIHGCFGFANYTCELNGTIQHITSTVSSSVIGADQTWHKIHLRNTIENSATNVFNLEADEFTVSIHEAGAFSVNVFIISALPLGFNGTLTACIFVDKNDEGQYDVLRRVAFQCDNLDFIGDSEFGPLLVTSAHDMFSLTAPGEVVVRYLLLSDTITNVAIVTSRICIQKM